MILMILRGNISIKITTKQYREQAVIKISGVLNKVHIKKFNAFMAVPLLRSIGMQ